MPIAHDDVLNALKQCYDPEIPVNIVDLGLIYDIRFDDLPEGQQDVTVDMTPLKAAPSTSTSAPRSSPGLSNFRASATPTSMWSGNLLGLPNA